MRKLKHKLRPTFIKKHMSKLRTSVTTKLQTAYDSFKILLRPLLNSLSLIINLVTILFQTPTVHTSSNTSIEDTSLGDKEKRTTRATATATSELAAAQETITRLQLKLSNAEKTVKAAESNLVLEKKQASVQKTAHEAAKSQDIAMQKKEANQVKSELITARAKVERLQTENDLTKKEAKKLQSRLITENAATETARFELTAVKKEACQQKQELAAANARVEELLSQLSSEKGAAEAEKCKLETEAKELITETQSQLKTAQAATKVAESKSAAVQTLDDNNYTFENYAIMFIEVIIKRFKINIDWHAKVLKAYFDKGESPLNIKLLTAPSPLLSSFYPGVIQFESCKNDTLAIQATHELQSSRLLSIPKENFYGLHTAFETRMSEYSRAYSRTQDDTHHIAGVVFKSQRFTDQHSVDKQSLQKIYSVTLSLAHMASYCSDLCRTDPLIESIATGLRCTIGHSKGEVDNTPISSNDRSTLVLYITKAQEQLASEEQQEFETKMCSRNNVVKHPEIIKTMEQLQQTYRDMTKLLHKSLCRYTIYALTSIQLKDKAQKEILSVFDTIQNCEKIIQSKLGKDTSLQTDRPNPEVHDQNVYNWCKARAIEINNILQHKEFNNYLGCRYTSSDSLENIIRHQLAQKIIKRNTVWTALNRERELAKKQANQKEQQAHAKKISSLQQELKEHDSNEQLGQEWLDNYRKYKEIFSKADEHSHNASNNPSLTT